MHDPALVRCTVEPVTLQLPPALKLTGRPEVALALTMKSGSPNVLFANAPNVIIWFALAIENACGTSAAALKLLFPLCDAVIVHDPALAMWTVEPVTLQLPPALKLTVRPEVALALTMKSGSPNVLFARGANVIVWFALITVNVGELLLPECTLSGANVPVITCAEGVVVNAVRFTEQLAVAPLPPNMQVLGLKVSLRTFEPKVMVPLGVLGVPWGSSSVTVRVTMVC